MPPYFTAGEENPTADFVYADFNSTHGLTFAGASGTTACANVTELEYGDVQGDADQLQGSLDVVTREGGGEVVTTDVRTSELEEHDRITPVQVCGCACCGAFTSALMMQPESSQASKYANGTMCIDIITIDASCFL